MKKPDVKRTALCLLLALMLVVVFPLTALAAEHDHSWSYAQGYKFVTASCGCGESHKLTLAPPEDPVYDGTEKRVVVNGADASMTYTEIYFDTATGTQVSAPVAVGSYAVTVQFGGSSLSLEYSIGQAVIDTLDLDALVVAPVAGEVPQDTVVAPVGCEATISWSPADTSFAYHTVYTATVRVKAVGNYRFADDISVAGWNKAAESGELIFTKAFEATEKETVTALVKPTFAASFSHRYATAEAAIAALPQSVAVTVGGRTEQLPVQWLCSYNPDDNAVNTFTWVVASDEYAFSAGVETTGQLTIANAAAAIKLTHSGVAFIHFGRTWGTASFGEVLVYPVEGERVDVAGTWEFVDVSADERPVTEGKYSARFTPDDPKYEIYECELEMQFHNVSADVEVVLGGLLYPTQTVRPQISVTNPYCDTWFVPAEHITVRYRIGEGAETVLTGDYSFVLPEDAAGKTITITVAVAKVDTETLAYNQYSLTRSFAVENRIAVNHTAQNDTVKYNKVIGGYDFSKLFGVDPNAGAVTYEVIYDPNSIAEIRDGTTMLVIRGIGTVRIRMTTAANGIYAGGEAVAELTVQKGDGSGTVNIQGWTYGASPNAPQLTSSTNGTAGAILLYKGTANDGSLYESATPPTKAGSYTVSVTYPETALYLSCNATASFTIGKATPSLGEIHWVGTLFDTTEVSSIVLTRTDATVAGTLSLYDIDHLEVGDNTGKYLFTPEDTDNYIQVSGELVLTAVKDTVELLQLSGALTQLDYIHGDTLNPDGLVIRAIYTSGAEEVLALSDPELLLPVLAAGDTSAVLEYRGVKVVVNGISVDKKTVSVGGVSADTDAVYAQGKPQVGFTGTPVSEYTGSYVITYEGTTNGGDAYGPTTTPPVAAGDYTVTVAIPAEAAGYRGEVSMDFTVQRAAIDVSGVAFAPNAGGYVYDGTEQVLPLGAALPDGVTGTFEQNTAVGAGKYTARVTLAPADPDNYVLEGAAVVSCAWEISKAKIDVSQLAFDVGSYTYNKTEQGPSLIGEIPAGVIITFHGNRAVNAGDYVATAVVSLADGYSADNYEIVGSVADAVWSIAKRTVTVQAQHQNAYVSHALPTLTYTAEGLCDGDGWISEPQLSIPDYVDAAGVYVIEAAAGDAGSNYEIVYKNGRLTITHRTGAGGISIQGWIYGEYDAAINAPISSVDHDATPVFHYEGITESGAVYSGTQIPTEAGSYTVYATFEQTAKYAAYVTDTVGFTIEKAMPTISLPTDLTAFFGDTLAKVSLPDGFRWQASASTAVGNAGDRIFLVTYTPEDTDNYYTVTNLSVTVHVQKLDISEAYIGLPFEMFYNGEQQTRFYSISTINGQKVQVQVRGNTATNVGRYVMELTGTGNFTGSRTIEWSILPLDISKATVVLDKELIYNGGVQTQGVASVMVGDVVVDTFIVGGQTKAAAVGIYSLTLEGTGNFVGECSVRWTIAPDTSAIDSLTPENVTAADREDIEGVLDQIQSEEAKKEWADVVDRCEELLEAIANSQRTIDDLLAQLAKYHIDTVTSADEPAIRRLDKEIVYLLEEGGLTEEQIRLLEAGEDKIEALLGRIAEVAAKLKDIRNRLKKYEDVKVTEADRAALEALLTDINALLDGDNLSALERIEMETAKKRVERLLDSIDTLAEQIDRITGLLDAYDVDTVKSSDKTDIEDIMAQIAALLAEDALTDAQKAVLDADNTKGEALLERIAAVAAAMEDVLSRLDQYELGTVKSTDKEALEAIVADIDVLLEGDNLTPEERSRMEDAKRRAADLLGRIADAHTQANTENVEKSKELTSETVTPADRETLEDAKADLDTAIKLYDGNYTEQERAAIDEALQQIEALLAQLDKIQDVQDKIDALPDDADPSDEDAKDAYEDAKDAYDDLTDHEKEQIDKDKLDQLEEMLGNYAIIEGADGKWSRDEQQGLGFVANGALGKLDAILIDGVAVDAAGYTAAQPQTTITLTTDTLKALTDGKHTLVVRYTDGEASCDFTVEPGSELVPVQPDEDNSLGWLWAILIIVVVVAGAAVIFFLIYKKKEESEPESLQ